MPKFFDDVVHILGGGFDRRGTGCAAQAAIARAVTLVEIQIDEGDILELDVLPNINLGPIQQRMNADVGAGRKGRLVLIPELRRLVSEIPVSMFIPWRE